MTQTIIDANFILRWFLNDRPDQADTANKLIRETKPNSLIIDRLTLAEITYVLRSKGYDHQQIFQLLEELYDYPSISQPTILDWQTLQLFAQTNLDFEDCFLATYAKENHARLATFDQDLQKQANRMAI